jgi:hypothetical protein
LASALGDIDQPVIQRIGNNGTMPHFSSITM